MRDEDFDTVLLYTLKKSIRQSNYTQTRLAQLMGVSRRTINRYLNGEVNITAKDLNKLIDILGIDSNRIFDPSKDYVDYVKADITSTVIRVDEDRKKRIAKQEEKRRTIL